MGDKNLSFSAEERAALTFADIGVVVFAGLGVPLAGAGVSQLSFLAGLPFAYELAFVAALAAVGVYVGCRFRSPQRTKVLVAIYLLLPVGIGLDAAIHGKSHAYAYGLDLLLPLEIVVYLVLASLPLWLGCALGRRIARRRMRRRQADALA